MFKFLFAFTLITLSVAGEIDFKDCGADYHSPNSLDVSDCDETPCEVSRGNDATFTFTFTSPIDADDLTVEIKALVFGVWIPWPGAPKQVCGQQIECPLVSGKDYTYKATVTIPEIAPSISTTVQYSLEKASSKENVFCARVPIHVA